MADIEFLLQAQDEINIAERLSGDELKEMAHTIIAGIEADEDTRVGWIEEYDKWQELAAQVVDRKSFPWDGAANIKYPLMNVAAIQFHARAYPEIVNQHPVKADVLGVDPEGMKREVANRISNHMSYQLIHEMDGWQEETDRLLMGLPIAGVMFRKVYYSPDDNKLKTELVTPQNLVVNYHAKSLDRAPRVTHIQHFFHNEILEMINAGVFLECELNKPKNEGVQTSQDRIHNRTPTSVDIMDEVPHTVYECHTWWDLDDDGYKEPYIITVEKDSRKVLRIVARFDTKGMEFTEEGRLFRIKAFNHFQNYIFIPDPNSSIYGLGFGHLLGPTNEAVNTLINQLVDAGTLSNLQSGFLSKGIRVKGGSTSFRPGEWKITTVAGEDLQRGVYPLPVREPSHVLFQLLGMLIESGERLSSVTDIMVGENPGQNQPASTTMAVLEQGQKVFTGIFKRIYRALTGEYNKMKHINSRYIDAVQSYMASTGAEEQTYWEDYQIADIAVKPSANPENITDAQKLIKAEALMPLVQIGLINPQEFARRYVEAQGHEDIESLLQAPEPQPDPEVVLEMEKFEHERQLDWANLELQAVKSYAMAERNRASALENIARADSVRDQDELSRHKQALDTIRTRDEMVNERIDRLVAMTQEQQQQRAMEQAPVRGPEQQVQDLGEHTPEPGGM